MATNAAFPPYEYWEGDAIVGIDAVVAGLIADQLGMKLDIQDMDFDAIIPAVVSGKVDMGMAGMTVTDERLQSVSFSESYATGVQVVIVPEGSPIETVDQLFTLIDEGEDVQIGTQNATTGFIYASDDFGEDHVQAFNKGADAVQALVTGKLTCVIIDNEPAKAFVAANNG
jgi:polar amino acid transport system substrate-binding protein